jgi:hypothetical protein
MKTTYPHKRWERRVATWLTLWRKLWLILLRVDSVIFTTPVLHTLYDSLFFIMPGISEVVFFHKDFNKIEIFCYRFDYRIVLFVFCFCFLFFVCLFCFSFIRIFRRVYTLHYIITLAYNDIVTIYLE